MDWTTRRITAILENALLEDRATRDATSYACIDANERAVATILAKQECVLSGVACVHRILDVFAVLDGTVTSHPEVTSHTEIFDGVRLRKGQSVAVIRHNARVILSCERVILNIMQRMSGIATLTRQYVDRLQRYKTRILDTRKTTPNFRLLEKEAVRIGGGLNHRFGLFDMMLLKDNHIDYAGSLEAAIEKASTYRQTHKPQLKIEVETRNIEEVRRVLAIGKVDRIMLDNFTPRQVAEALSLIGERFETEASGGIHLGNIEDYARTGVDYVSVGALIHQARSLDMSMKAVML